MRRMQIKMGKYAIKNSSLGNTNHHEKRLSRDSCLEESNDSGLGPEFQSSLPESSSSLEESDVDNSSDSVDSGISCRHRRLIKAKSRSSNSLVSNNSTTNPTALYSPYSMMHIETSLSMSLNHKMHIHQKQTDGHDLLNCHNEPLAKRRKMLPLMSLQEEKPRRSTVHHYPSTVNNTGVLTEAPICVNSIGRDAYENSLVLDLPRDNASYKGTPEYSTRNGDHIAALLSPNSHALSRKRSNKKPSLHQPFPQVSKDGKVELRILVQPEEQHRARYMTEGSRGSIKDEKGTGFPTVKLIGHNQPVVLQIFIGCDQGKVQPHLFYQACKVTGKNCTPCMERLIDGTCVIEIQLDPTNDMSVSCDCIGILKERNVDVEQRLPYFGLSRCKKRSTKCRMVFRVNIPLSNGTYDTLQITSSPILCTQSPGLPEICKKSLSECSVKGGTDLFIIGKNFQKDARITFTELARDEADPMAPGNVIWEESVEPEKEYMHQSHLVCSVPPYRDQEVQKAVKVMLSVSSGGKSSEPHIFAYTPIKTVIKEDFDNLNYEMPNRIHTVPVEIKQEWNSDSATSDGSSSSMPNMMGSVASMIQQVIADPMENHHSNGHHSPSALMSMNMPPLQQHMVAPTTVGSLMMSPSSTMVNAISLSTVEEQQQQQPSSYSLVSHTELPISSKVVEENHHDVDLISGINQLASEMAIEQQRLNTSETARLMSELHECNSSQNLGSLGPSATFSQENCYSASNEIKHEVEALTSYCPKMDLANSNLGGESGLFLTAPSSATSSMCPSSLELNTESKMANGLYCNDEMRQKSNYLMSAETGSHVSSLSETSISRFNPVPETVAMPNMNGVEYGPLPNPTLMLPTNKLSSLVGSCPNIAMAVVAENPLHPDVVPVTRMNNGQGAPPMVLIKNEKVEMQAAQPQSSGQSQDMTGFQQSMTYALSQLSDADLLSMINPNTFDHV